MKAWDIKYYDEINLPEVIGHVRDGYNFSRINPNGPVRPMGRVRILEMVIKEPGEGIKLPGEMSQWLTVIRKVLQCEQEINPNWLDYYMYITIDQKQVWPGKSQRRPGWHGDGFDDPKVLEQNGVVDNTYICYDCMPTLFKGGPFSFPEGFDINDHKAVLEHFGRLANDAMPLTVYPNYSILKLTPYCIHDVCFNEGEEPIDRTFVKISFSRQRFNLIGNSKNPHINYDDWEWKEPDMIRNVRYRIKDE
jgi:hypothetical protein